MKRLIVVAMLLVGTAFSVLGREQKTKLATCPAGWTAGPNADWKIFWNDALAEAHQTGKKIFVLSTGSDWCGWCMKLKKDVFEKDEFKDYARKKLVLLYLDSPRKPLPEDQKQHNDAICGTLSFGGGVPCAAVFGVDSRRYGVISGYSKTPSEYIARIDEVLAKDGEMPKSGQPPRIFAEGYFAEAKDRGSKSDKRGINELAPKKSGKEYKAIDGIVWYYEANNGMATILRMKTPSQFDGHVSVPEYIEGNLVTCIRALSPDVVSLKVPEGVGCFGGTSVPWMPRLESLSLPSSWRDDKSFEILSSTLKTVTINPSNENFTVVGGLVCDKEMERVVFCPGGVEEVVLPESIEDVSKLFRYTGKLRNIRVEPGNSCFEAHDGVLYDKGMLTLVRCPNVREKIVIPPSAKVISAQAFCGCKALSEVRIPDTVTEVGSAAFSSCTGLCAVVLSKNLTCISRCMFSDCTGLKLITLPQSIREIGWGAFADCSSLQSVRVDNSEEGGGAEGQTVRVNDAAFLRCGNLTSIDLPGSDVQISSEPFEGCTNLTELAFLPRMQELCTYTLKGTGYYRAMSNGTPIIFHSRLMGIKAPVPSMLEIPSGVEEVAGHAFSGNKDLKSVVIPVTVTNIGSRAFSGCSQLEIVTLLPSAIEISLDAFSGCSSLKSIVTPTDDTNRLTRIERAFGRKMRVLENGKLTVLPKQENEKAKRWYSAKENSTHSRRQASSEPSSERVWHDPQTGINWRFSVYKGEASLGVHNHSGEVALIDASYAGDLVIPEVLDGYPVRNVYDSAFVGCTNLTSIHIPRTVKQFRAELSALVSLTNVTVDVHNPDYRSRGRFLTSVNGKQLFSVCAGGVKRIDIPDGVESISWCCLSGAHWLEDVHIPSTVRDIDATAFIQMRRLTQKHDPEGKGYLVIDGWLIPIAQFRGRKLIVPAGVRHVARVDSFGTVWPDVYEVELPDGLETIGEEVFSGANIKTVEFPKSMRRCDGFAKKRFPLGRSSGKERALRNVVFNSGNLLFSIPDSVRRVTFAEGVTDVGVAFEGRHPSGLSGGNGVKTVVLPAGLRSIRMLPDFPELTEITIPSSVTNIGESVFQHSAKLKSVGVEKDGSVEFVSIDEFRRRWNLVFPDGNLHLTDAKTGIRWLCKRDYRPHMMLRFASVQDVCCIRIVGIEGSGAPSALVIPATLAGLTVDDVDWGKMALPSVVELRIPRTLKRLDRWWVANAMPNLQTVVVEEGNESYRSYDGVLCDAKDMSVVYCPCAKKGRVTIADGIERVAYGAFEGCTNLTEVVLPLSVKTIGVNAFSGCSQLEKVILPEGLREIGVGAFDGCVKLFETTKRYDGFYVLNGWAVDPWGVGVVEHGVLGGRLALPDGVRGVADRTFAKREIPNFATNETRTVQATLFVSLPRSLRHIGRYAFCGNAAASIELPDGLCSVGERAFSDCTNLLSVSVPSTIESWDKMSRTFYGCSRLRTMRLSEGLRTLPWDGLRDCCSIESVSIPASVTNGLTAAFLGCPSLLSVEVSPENPKYKSIDGVAYTKDGKKLVCCPQGKQAVTIPSSVEDIGSYAFKGCSLIEAIDLPSTVTNIDSWAFDASSSLRSIRIPRGVLELKQGTFSRCSALKDVQIPQTTTLVAPQLFEFSGLTKIVVPSGVTNIGDFAFRSCTNLISLAIPSSVKGIGQGAFSCCQGITNIAIPEGVECIGHDAFGNCSRLMEISVPSTVTNIELTALRSCENLKTVVIDACGMRKTIGMDDFRRQRNLSGLKDPPSRPTRMNSQRGGSLIRGSLRNRRIQSAAELEESRVLIRAINEELKSVREAKTVGERQKDK